VAVEKERKGGHRSPNSPLSRRINPRASLHLKTTISTCSRAPTCCFHCCYRGHSWLSLSHFSPCLPMYQVRRCSYSTHLCKSSPQSTSILLGILIRDFPFNRLATFYPEETYLGFPFKIHGFYNSCYNFHGLVESITLGKVTEYCEVYSIDDCGEGMSC
jgi:hypothetical protein